MKVALVACYELGYQPLHVAAVAGRLRERGHDVRCLDLSLDPWDRELARWAERMAISVPMHTAGRIARQTIDVAHAERPDLPIAAFGLYAPVLSDVANRVLAGETDEAVVDWVEGRVDDGIVIHLGHGDAGTGAAVPARDLLPPLDRYVRLAVGGERRVVAHTEASHGCAHRCRHCPVPVVYDGRTRIVDAESVLADVTQQVAAGAQHVSFGDPDFFNGVHHALRIVRAVHERFPDLTFDCTVKVEHILRHAEVWSELADAGCLFVVSAFETVDEATLTRLAKDHTAADMGRAVELLRSLGIEIRPSWMPFTPWTTLDEIQGILDFVAVHDLVPNVDPVQYTIRLLVPPGSLLLDTPDLAPHLGEYDADRGCYEWRSAEPTMDELQLELAALVESHVADGIPAARTYEAVRATCGLAPSGRSAHGGDARPHLTETWFCCAEPTEAQLEPVSLSPPGTRGA
ncbi:MAG: CUAEP/CCAEP-tail radical SAM protein [Acidimicrobiia bacterium]